MLLKILESKGFTREEIEKGVGRSPNWIDQVQARGGNEKAYNLIKMFNEANVAKSNVTRETVEDTKEEILLMLKMSLRANIEHAAANTKNAAASQENAASIKELVRILGITLNSDQKSQAPQDDQEKDSKPRSPRERTRKFAGKQGIHSLPKDKKQRGISR